MSAGAESRPSAEGSSPTERAVGAHEDLTLSHATHDRLRFLFNLRLYRVSELNRGFFLRRRVRIGVTRDDLEMRTSGKHWPWTDESKRYIKTRAIVGRANVIVGNNFQRFLLKSAVLC